MRFDVPVLCGLLRWMTGLLAAGLVLTGSAALAQESQERIASYDVQIRVQPSGKMVITDTIEYDFGSSERHGIFRNIPVRVHYNEKFDRVYPLEVTSVEGSPGTPDEYELEDNGNFSRIRIGDPDRTITGRHRYTISYEVTGALNGFADHDELYWNAIGLDWEVPIERATVRTEFPGAVTEIACFSGPLRSTLPCDSADHQGSGATFSDAGLQPYEGITIVVGLPKGVVTEPAPVLDERWSFSSAFRVTPATILLAVVVFLASVVLVGRMVWKTGRDRRFAGSEVAAAFGGGEGQEAVPLLQRPIIPVQFEPPDGLRPGQVGILMDEVANPLDATATIVDLAVRGYLRIREIPKEGWFGKADWELQRLREPDGLEHYETLLVNGIFQDGEAVLLSDLKNVFAQRLAKVQDALYDDVVAKGWYRARPDKVRSRWLGIGALVLIAGAGLLVAAAAYTHLGLIAAPLPLAGLLILINAHRMPSRTAKGTATLLRTNGFRRFIEESEAERAQFAERKNLFSEYLPYAVVFGSTKKWARAFAGLDDELPETSWYVGHHGFTSGTFSSSLDGFTVTTAGTISSTPSGSGSSGFSGGSSGGGGGGGGGGSW